MSPRSPVSIISSCFTDICDVPASRSGSVGVVHLVEGDDDIAWIERNATAGPYTVILPFAMFNRSTLVRLKDTNNINGVLLTKNADHERPSEYSPEDQCPNRYSGYKKCDNAKPWNPFGSALLMEDWPFPMFYTEVRSVRSKNVSRQTLRGKHALQMNIKALRKS